MSQTYPLDTVIKEVPPHPKVSESSKEVLFETKKRQIVEKRTLFSANVKSFLVSNVDDDKQNFAEGEGPVLYVDDFKKDRKIGLSTFYRVSCSKGSEEKTVKALSDDIHPTAAFESKIKKWASEYLHDDETRFIDEFLTRKKILEGFIKRKANEEAGLNLDVRIELKPESLETFYINSNFPVVSRDYDEKEQYINVKIDIEVDENHIVNAVLAFTRLPELEKKIINELKKFFSKHVSLHQIYFGLKDVTLKNRMTDQLDTLLKDEGRKVKRIALEYKDDISKLEHFYQTKEDIKIDCAIHEYPDPVVIENKLQLQLEDVVSYRKSGSPELGKWLERNLEELIKKYLFDIKYIDLLLNFKPIEESIRNEIEARAMAIGYHLKLLIAGPNLKQLELTRSFTIDNSDNLEFDTKNSRYKVKLGISVRARIKDLKDIEGLLNRQADIIKEMKEAILDEVCQYMHSIDPKHFYINFEYSDDNKKPPVSKSLKSLISKRLKKDFEAEIINISLKNIDTDITKKFADMYGKLCEFKVATNPLGGDETVIFVGKFKVTCIDVDHWDEFLACKYKLEDIKNLLEEHVCDKFKFVKKKELLHNEFSKAAEIKRLASKLINEFSVNHFGLAIELINLSRELTEGEEIRFKVKSGHQEILTTQGSNILNEKFELEQKTFSSKSEEYDELLKKRKALIALDDNDEEVAEIDRKIAVLKEELDNYFNEADRKQQESLGSDSSGSTVKDMTSFVSSQERNNKALPGGRSNNKSENDLHERRN